jgi:DNA-binding MarR family transcriptional regulator
MSAFPSLSTRVIGQAESALGALLDPVLARAGITFQQWLVLTLTAASGAAIDRDQLVAQVTSARKVDEQAVLAAIAGLAAAGLAEVVPGERAGVRLTDAGQARHRQIRTTLGEITGRLFGDLPAEDLATAGRVLAIVTGRANAELAAA